MMEDRSWLEIAADLRWACPLGLFGLVGGKSGEAMPLSDFVGLVLKTVIESPARMFPPTNSLPPLRCPVPILAGIVLGDSGTAGDCGGLKKEFSAIAGDGRDAPGLKEKAGSAGDLGLVFSFSEAIATIGSGSSIVDRGRLPVARENDEGAE